MGREKVEIALTGGCRVALDRLVDVAFLGCRCRGQLAGVVAHGVLVDRLQGCEGGTVLRRPEGIRGLLDGRADVVLENVIEYGLLNARHIDVQAGDGALVRLRFGKRDGTAGRIAGFIAVGKAVAPGDKGSVGDTLACERLWSGNKLSAASVAGASREIHEIHAKFAVDQSGNNVARTGNLRLGEDDRVRSYGLHGIGIEGFRHADTPEGALLHELLARREPAAKREHHDRGEADADDEYPRLAAAENL